VNVGVTPLGAPLTENAIVPVKVSFVETEIVYDPPCPAIIFGAGAFAEADTVKSGAAVKVTETLVEADRAPLAPANVISYVPGDNVSVAISTLTDVVPFAATVAVAGVNTALRPLGVLVADRVTFPAKLFCERTEMV
jgi:hypothetical protein